jgi:hypothetical protein
LLDFVILSPFCLKKTTERKDDKTIDVVFSGDKTKSRQDGKMPSEKSTINTLYNPQITDLICRLFAWHFVVLSSFWVEKTIIIVLSHCLSIVFSRRKEDKMPSEKMTN